MNVRQGLVVSGSVPYEDVADVAAERDFDYVEIDMEQAFPRERFDADAIRSVAAERDLDVVVHLPYRLDPASPHEHVREGACRELEAAIDAAIELGAERGVFHAQSFAAADTWGTETLADRLYDSVRRLSAYAVERDFDVCVENLKTAFFDAGDFPDLFERTDALACLDTGHAYVTGQDAAAQADLLREHGDRISHVHLNDTRREDDDEHLPVGLGRLDFSALTAAMADADWTGTCTHEVFMFDAAYGGHGKAAFDALLPERAT